MSTSPWAEPESERERRWLDLLDRLDPWVVRVGWLLVAGTFVWFGGSVGLRAL